jgi:hypothetical protein
MGEKVKRSNPGSRQNPLAGRTVLAKSRQYVSQLISRPDPHQPPARSRCLARVVVGFGHIPFDKAAALGVPDDSG